MPTFAQTTLVRYARWGLVAASIAVTAACGGGGGGGGAPSTPANMASPASVASTGIDLVLNANRVSGVAPLAVSFNSIGTTADAALTTRPFHELSYKWEFSDTSDVPDWTYGATPAARKKNIAYGPVAGHVFEKPGTWTVTLTAVSAKNRSVTAQKTLTISVADPAALTTVCVSNSGIPVPGVAGCPAGAAGQMVPSWAGIGSLTDTYKRVLLKRGDVWSSDGHLSISSSRTGGIVGAYGAGNVKPKVILVSNNAGFYLAGTSDWRILDVEVSGNGIQGASKQGIVFTNGSNVLISGVSISDVFIGVSSGIVRGLTIEASHIYGLYDASGGHPGIAMYLENTDELSILGSKFSDSPTTHVIRLQGVEKSVISNNQIEMAGPSRNALTIRGKSTSSAFAWNGNWTQHVVVNNNIIDNSVRGGYALYVGPQSTGHAERIRDVIIEGNYIKSRELYAANFQVAENLSVRNNILSTYYAYAIGLGLGGNVAGSPATKGAYIYHNTIYKVDTSMTSNFSAFYLSSPGLASEVRLSNNIVYAVGNNRNGAGNGSGATLLAQGGVVGSDGTHFFTQGNTDDVDIAVSKPWTSINPTDPVHFKPDANYASSGNTFSLDGGVWDFTYQDLSSSRLRGALER